MTLLPQNPAFPRARRSHLIAVVIAGLFAQISLAQSQYEIPRTTSKPVIDGEMAAQEWADALSISITVETEPGENLPAEVATEGLVRYIAGLAVIDLRRQLLRWSSAMGGSC